MHTPPFSLSLFGAAFALASVMQSSPPPAASAQPRQPSRDQTVRGEALDPSAFGPSWVESMEDVMRRERESPPSTAVQVRHRPMVPPHLRIDKPVPDLSPATAPETGPGGSSLGGGGSTPIVGTNFVGPKIGDAGGGWVPPDTCGAVGLNHFVSIVNSNISVWNKTTGARLMNVGQGTFWATGSLGDGRATFDPHSQRFILISDDFSSRIYLAVSSTSDPTGAWFKTSINVSQGVDAGHWPDYPTLGVDANGIYTSSYMVGAPDNMSLFAINKAPLVAPVQSLGAVTAFRSLPWEGAIQPCVTHGTPSGEYCVTYSTLYRVNPPLTAPTLTNLGSSQIGGFSSPPNSPNMGGNALDTLDGRLMNAVYRNGSVWTAHAVFAGGKSGCRWYQINVSPVSLAQAGTVDDPTRYYFMPGISVNANNNMLLGFTGSSSSQFAGCYVSGRKSTDPSGQTGPAVQFKAGEAGYNDGGNPSRWGDYSLTSVDPTNDLDFWTIQEYARTGNNWGTWISEVEFDTCNAVPPSNFCVTSPNTAGPGATMTSSGTNSISQNNFTLITIGAPPNKSCIYLYGQNQSVSTPLGNGTRCIGSPFFRLPLVTSNLAGDAMFDLDLNNLPASGQIHAGESWGFQCWYRDPQAPGATTNISDGLSTTWCP